MVNQNYAPALKFRQVSKRTLRDAVAQNDLNPLEYGLLKKWGDKVRVGNEQKECLLNMVFQHFEAQQGLMKIQVHLRSFCHSKDVTSDYLKIQERFNMKPCVLVLGDLGCSVSPWADLLQPALSLFMHETNILIPEAPGCTDPKWWIECGPTLINGLLKYMQIERVNCIACGVGGAIFTELLAHFPQLFGKTHMVYNLNLTTADQRLPIHDIEEDLRDHERQLWFTYQDEFEVFERDHDGPPQAGHQQIQKMQSRLEGERKRGRRECPYDEVLVTEMMNIPRRVENTSRFDTGKSSMYIFSDEFLESIYRFMEQAPFERQEILEQSHGLVADPRSIKQDRLSSLTDELPALRKLRLGPTSMQRTAASKVNRKLLTRMPKICDVLQPADHLNALPAPMFPPNALPAPMLSRTGSQGTSRSALKLHGGSRVGSHVMFASASTPALHDSSEADIRQEPEKQALEDDWEHLIHSIKTLRNEKARSGTPSLTSRSGTPSLTRRSSIGRGTDTAIGATLEMDSVSNASEKKPSSPRAASGRAGSLGSSLRASTTLCLPPPGTPPGTPPQSRPTTGRSGRSSQGSPSSLHLAALTDGPQSSVAAEIDGRRTLVPPPPGTPPLHSPPRGSRSPPLGPAVGPL